MKDYTKVMEEKEKEQQVTPVQPVKKKPSKRRKKSPSVARSEPPPAGVIPGLRALVERPSKPQPSDEPPIPVVNVKFNFAARKWEVFDDKGQTIELFEEGYMIDVKFVVVPCGKENIGCGGGKVDVECGHAVGKLVKGKPQSIPANWPPQRLQFDELGAGFYSLDGGRNLYNIQSADYLIVSSSGRPQVVNPKGQ